MDRAQPDRRVPGPGPHPEPYRPATDRRADMPLLDPKSWQTRTPAGPE
ncbi:hypothetical protein [Streptomyces sp. NPDC093060]